jgi:hypothetical protein
VRGVLCARKYLGSFAVGGTLQVNSMQMLLVLLDVHVWIEGYI